MCFDPRHALRVTANSHTYDLLLCYECQQLDVYEDDKRLLHLGATGSPEVLNALLMQLSIPLAKLDLPEDLAADIKKYRAHADRWRAAMPKSVRPFWEETNRDEKPL